MAAVTKKIKIPAVPERTVTRVTQVICDLCRAETYEEDLETPDWTSSHCDVAETTIRMKFGRDWGSDGYSYRITVFHVCPKCFKEVLQPFFRERGVLPTEITKEDL